MAVMNSDISTQLTALQGARTHASPQIAMVRKNNEADMATAAMIDTAVRPAPPPEGMGTKVDRTA
jgi:hypothetical protein